MANRDRRIYLDHNATSPVRPEAVRAVRDVLASSAANPSSLHAEGRRARAIVEEAREKVAALVQLPPRDLVFTSGGSEAIAAAVRGVCDRAPEGRRRIVVSSVEHSSVLEAARLAARWGFEAVEVPCDRDGRVLAEEFAARLDDDVCLAALQWANNETGVIQPVETVSHSCAAAGIPLLVDAVQGAGKISLDPRMANLDLVALSGHKFGGPQGSGALIVREGLKLAPLITGGAQEKRRRGGTEAVALTAGFGAAAEAALGSLKEASAKLLRLRVHIETRLRERCPQVSIRGDGAPRLPNTVNFALSDVPGETLVIALDVAGFALSTGSACASGSRRPSHVIRAMGLGEKEARASVRVSLGWNTSEDEVERFLEALPRLVEQVRKGLLAED